MLNALNTTENEGQLVEALIEIDYTNDFVAADGHLTVGKPAQEIESRVIELMNEFEQKGDYVVLATDIHYENDPFHPETNLFPPHNIAGTNGRKFYGELEPWYQAHKDKSNVYMMDKTRYSAFSGTDLDLRLRARSIDTVHLIGVCTDICVLHTAVDAYNLGYKIIVHEKATASFNQIGHEWALSHFKDSMGAEIKE